MNSAQRAPWAGLKNRAPRRALSSGRRPTCRRSRRKAKKWTLAPTFFHSASCSTKCSQVKRLSAGRLKSRHWRPSSAKIQSRPARSTRRFRRTSNRSWRAASAKIRSGGGRICPTSKSFSRTSRRIRNLESSARHRLPSPSAGDIHSSGSAWDR